MKSIIVTADDLGLDPSINDGIVEAYKNGLVTCSALLMNAPSTDEGIVIAKDNPGLEVGIHLSIVEGFSLRNIHSTITSETSYFENGICKIQNFEEYRLNASEKKQVARYLLPSDTREGAKRRE